MLLVESEVLDPTTCSPDVLCKKIEKRLADIVAKFSGEPVDSKLIFTVLILLETELKRLGVRYNITVEGQSNQSIRVSGDIVLPYEISWRPIDFTVGKTSP